MSKEKIITVEEAIKHIRSRKNRRWLRFHGEDYLNESDVKRLKKAGTILAKEIERLQSLK